MIEQIKSQIRPRTAYKDACRILQVEPLTRETYNFLPEREGDYDWAEHKIKRVADAMNKITGFEVDYKNNKQRKWHPTRCFSKSEWILKGSDYTLIFPETGHRLNVSSQEESDYLFELMKKEFKIIDNVK